MKYVFLLVMLAPVILMGQSRITGTVKDERKEPIAGANIILLNTYDGASSDVNGFFEFSSTETGNQVLVVRFIGYKDR